MSLANAEAAADAEAIAGAEPGPQSAWARGVAEGRALLLLATPITLIALVNMGMSVTDALMVSAIFGTDALAAVAVGSDLYSIVFYLGAGIIAGISPFYTAAVTRADLDERQRLGRIGWMNVVLIALLAAPLVWSAPHWLRAFGLAPALLHAGRGYTEAMALTLVPMLGVVFYRTILTAAEKPKVFLKVTLAMLPLNALGNYIFMTGSGPLPALGPAGAGYSSLLVALASLLCLAAIARFAARDGIAASRRFTLHDWRGMWPILRVGIPIGVMTVTEVGIFLAATLYAARLGSADVAAHTLTLRTAGIAYAVPAALLQAAMVRMARAGSLADPQAAITTSRAVIAGGLGLGLILGTLTLVLLAAAATPLAVAFFDGSAVGLRAAEIAVGLLLLLGLLEFVANPGLAAAGMLRGRKDTRAPMLYTLAGYWLIGAPLGLYLCEIEGAGITGIWLGLAAGTLTTAILTLARLLSRPRFTALSL